MRRLLSLLLILCLVGSILPYKATTASAAETEPIVQVKLMNYLGNKTDLKLEVTGAYHISGTSSYLEKGKTYLVKKEGNVLNLYHGSTKLSSNATFTIKPVNYQNHAKINDREYQGSFAFKIDGNYIRPINSIFMDDYLKGVVPYEMPGSWHKEALKAQAVAARTYAYKKGNTIIDDTISNQVYGGVTAWYANSTAAINETTGQILTFNGKAIDAMYSASNGGMTESALNNTGYEHGYLVVKQDEFDPKTTWDASVEKTQINVAGLDLKNPDKWWNTTIEKESAKADVIKKWLNELNVYKNKQVKITSIQQVTLHTKNSSGRVTKGDITVRFLVKDIKNSSGDLVEQEKTLTRNAASFRTMFGSREMTSYLVTSVSDNGTQFVATGLGDGHGVGLSQWGAKKRADEGHSYKSILSFYYANTELVASYSLASRTGLEAKVSGWVKDGSYYYYYNPTTNQPTKGWLTLNGKRYFFDNDGRMKTGWVYTSSKWYYMDGSGVMKTGWIYSGGKWYFMDTAGVMKTGWVKTGNKWYYMDGSGAMKTGWVFTGGKWYFMDASGAMKTGWLKTGGKWYYLEASGAMKTGWLKTGGKWYYLDGSGKMATGTITISGKRYKFNGSGIWVG